MECIVCIRNYFVKQSLQLDLSVTPALTLVIPFSTSTWPISSRGWLHAYETGINLSLMVIRSFDYAKLIWKTIRFMFRPRTSVKTVNWTDTDPQWKGLSLIRLSINLAPVEESQPTNHRLVLNLKGFGIKIDKFLMFGELFRLQSQQICNGKWFG